MADVSLPARPVSSWQTERTGGWTCTRDFYDAGNCEESSRNVGRQGGFRAERWYFGALGSRTIGMEDAAKGQEKFDSRMTMAMDMILAA
jgi:hypothetical protein